MIALKRLILSFLYAFRGIGYCIRNCRNFRIHTVAAFFVIYVSRFYNFSETEYCVLFLIISLVLILEAINTAIEQVCDKIGKEYSDTIKHAKDVAAGAVLISSICSVAIAFVLFWDAGKFKILIAYHTASPLAAFALVALAVLSVIYIFYEDIFRHGKK